MRRAHVKCLRDHVGLSSLDQPSLGRSIDPNRRVVGVSSGQGCENLFFDCTMVHDGRGGVITHRTLVPGRKGHIQSVMSGSSA